MKFLKSLWEKWLKIAHIIGNFQAQVILTLFYFTFVLPFGVLLQIFSDPLRINFSKSRSKTNFQVWRHKKDTLEIARRQF
jgi:hypothetical protein